jgi:anti-anti-sigma factor
LIAVWYNTLISEDVKDILSKFICHPKSHLILDLNGVEFIDSCGFAALCSMLDAARENNCTFQFKNVSEEVKELINLMQLSSSFEICGN